MLTKQPTSGYIRALLLAAPFIYGIAVFTAVASNQFWLDDYGWVSTAARATHDASLLLETRADFFRPVVNLVFYVNFLTSEIEPAGYYRVNIALHLINTGLLMLLASQLTKRNFWVTVLTGMLYAGAIGNYGEAVIWISGRTELIAALFILAALNLFWRYLSTRKLPYYLGTLGCFTLALLSKESAVTLLPALFLLEWLADDQPLSAQLKARNLLVYLPFAALLAPYLVGQFLLIPDNVVVEERQYAIGLHAVPNLLEYLALMIVPVGPDSTVVDVPDSLTTILEPVHVALGILLAGFWTMAFVRLKDPAFRFAVAWMTLSILPYAFFTTRTTTRYLYLPGAGFALAAAILVATVLARHRRFWITHRLARVGLVTLLLAVLALQWIVINTIIQQWSTWQAEQDPLFMEQLTELSQSLGFGR